jgi:hypothetical protein
MKNESRYKLSQRPLWNKFPKLYEVVLTILFQHDPVRICDDSNDAQETEYASEVETILPRLKEATSAQELQQIVYEESIRWFDASAGPIERYNQIAHDIWSYIETSGQQAEIAMIPDDLPSHVLSAIANVSIRYPDFGSQDVMRVAEVLRKYADHLERRARRRSGTVEHQSEFRTLNGFLTGQEVDEEEYWDHSATLRISGDDLDFEAINQALRLLPTRSHRKGERPGPRSPEYPQDMWLYSPPVPENHPLAEHVDALWGDIKHAREFLRSLKKTATVDVFLGYRSNVDTAGIALPHTSLEMFVELEIPFGMSIIVA